MKLTYWCVPSTTPDALPVIAKTKRLAALAAPDSPPPIRCSIVYEDAFDLFSIATQFGRGYSNVGNADALI